MSEVAPIIDLHPWLGTPAGRYLQAWERDQVDRVVANIFGFHAMQLGLPEFDTLRSNRMRHRWIALDSAYAHWRQPDLGRSSGAEASPAAGIHAPLLVPGALEGSSCDAQPADVPVALRCDFDALPFANNTLDLVVLPHALELVRDPHQTLREVERVLVPEGRVVIVGFNPASLIGVWQRLGRWGASSAALLPQGEFIAHWRLRDWLRLLGLEVELGSFGCYRPALRSEAWLSRLGWMDRAGDRWWPVLGAVYVIVACKRVRGMRLVGRLRKPKAAPHPAPAVLTNKHKDSLR